MKLKGMAIGFVQRILLHPKLTIVKYFPYLIGKESHRPESKGQTMATEEVHNSNNHTKYTWGDSNNRVLYEKDIKKTVEIKKCHDKKKRYNVEGYR